MSVGFFEIVFACNSRTTCEECRYEEICDKFQRCFETSPDVRWSKVSSFDDILRCVEKWRLYNEQTVKQ